MNKTEMDENAFSSISVDNLKDDVNNIDFIFDIFNKKSDYKSFLLSKKGTIMNMQYYIEYDANRLSNMRNRSSIMTDIKAVHTYINEKRRLGDYNFVNWRVLKYDGIKSTVIESGTESKELLLG